MELSPHLLEWDYTANTRASPPPRFVSSGRISTLWRDGCPGGEVARPTWGASGPGDRALLGSLDGDAVIFSHGHLLRVLTARWLGLGPESGALFTLDTGTLSALGYERETPVIRRWNSPVQ